jgi:hypothetical protein
MCQYGRKEFRNEQTSCFKHNTRDFVELMDWPKSRTYHGRTAATSRRPYSHTWKRKQYRRAMPVPALRPPAQCLTYTCRICGRERKGRSGSGRKPRVARITRGRVVPERYDSALEPELEKIYQEATGRMGKTLGALTVDGIIPR